MKNPELETLFIIRNNPETKTSLIKKAPLSNEEDVSNPSEEPGSLRHTFALRGM